MDNKVNTCEERFAKRAQKPIDAKPRAISSSGAASAEAKLVWIMPSRDRARRSQACLNIAEVRTDGAARGEAEFTQTIPSRDRGRRKSNDGAASVEANLVWIMPSRQRRRRSQTKVALPTIQCLHLNTFRTRLLGNAQHPSSFVLYSARNHQEIQNNEAQKEGKTR